MIELKISNILKAIQGEFIGEQEDFIINNVVIDSRIIENGNLFIAIEGENFDGHDFIEKAFLNGAKCCIVHKNIQSNKPIIKVDNTKQALMDLAKYYRDLFDIKVVAITGSTGKTTTKELISTILEQKYKVLKTEGNFNNEIGLPLTVFKLDKSIEVAVFELGMNHFGEIYNLSKIASPDICVITNIGVSHIEFLGSREGILKAKSEIFEFMKDDGKILLHGSDDMLKTLKDSRKNIFFYGIESDNNFYPKSIEYNGLKGSSFIITLKSDTERININLPGEHMIINALAGIGVGVVLDLNLKEIKKGIENFESNNMRQEIIKTEKYTIINDVYNANPNSMKAALDVLALSEGSKVCILGDMLELGEYSSILHYEIGEYAFKKGINIIVCVGKKAYNMYEGASRGIVDSMKQKQMAIYFDDQEMLLERLEDFVSLEDTILVKASRGMHFEKTVEKLI